MMTSIKNLVLAVVLLLTLGTVAGAATKTECKDHPLFPSRMPDYTLESCKLEDFGAYDFGNQYGPTKKQRVRVEGKFSFIAYRYSGARASEPSGLAVVRNYENAIKGVAGTIEAIDPERSVTGKVVKDGHEAWVQVDKGNGKIWLRIVEKQAMAQHVVADAAAFGNDIRTTGHAAVYGIYFDTGKADLKPESTQAIKEIAALLKGAPDLKIHVVGHTDNVGSVEANLKLSQERAQSVMQSLIRDHGIAANRLRAHGSGQFAPVASNDAEDGRARNRRVELVKQ